MGSGIAGNALRESPEVVVGLWQKRKLAGCLVVEVANPASATPVSWAEAVDELSAIFLLERGRAKGLVLVLGPSSSWKLRWSEIPEDSERREQFAKRIQEFTTLLAGSPLPVACVLTGNVRGLGGVLALAAHKIFVREDDDCRLGLGEIRSGLVAAGGTLVRLPKMIGSMRAAELLVLDEQLGVAEGARLGLFSVVDSETEIIGAAAKWAAEKHHGVFDRFLKPGRWMAVADEAGPVRRLRLKLVERQVAERIGRGFRAPFVVLDALAAYPDWDERTALEQERKLFVSLAGAREAQGIHRLRQATLLETAVPPPPSRRGFELAAARQRARQRGSDSLDVLVEDLFLERGHVAISGEPSLAAAVAILLASHGVRARIFSEESTAEAVEIEIGRALVWSERKTGVDKSLIRARVTVNREGFQESDLMWITCGKDPWLELRDGEVQLPPATPPVRVRLNGVAPGFVCLRLYPPFDDHSVAEVASSEESAPLLMVLRRCGRRVLSLNPGQEFLGAALFAALLAESVRLVDEGASIDEVDGALEEFGFRQGAFALADNLGCDFWAGALSGAASPEIHEMRALMDRMHVKGRMGRAHGSGFYRYDGSLRAGSDPEVYTFFREPLPGAGLRNRDIVERCLLRLLSVATAWIVSREGTESEAMLECDLVSTLVLGFPPWRGGLFFHAGTLGFGTVAERFSVFDSREGPRFSEPGLWQKLGDMAP